MNDSAKKYNNVLDIIKHTINKAYFSYSQPQRGLLLLKGKFKKDSLQIALKQYDMKKFLLLNRGFNWINEQAFNK